VNKIGFKTLSKNTTEFVYKMQDLLPINLILQIKAILTFRI